MKGKDRPKLKQTMQDMAHLEFPEEGKKNFLIGVNSPKTMTDNKVEEKKFDSDAWEKAQKEIREYNDKIIELDPDYTAFQPFQNVVVRMFHREESKSDAGLILDTGDIKTPQQAAGGSINVVHSYVNSPWKYQTKAVVVAVPEHINQYKPGDIVLVRRETLVPYKDTRGDFSLNQAFFLPEHYDFAPPRSVKDKHYGYMEMHPFNHIVGKLNVN